MPKPTEPPLSIAEVYELQPGAEDAPTWINPGFTGVVQSIDKKNSKAGKPFWPCTLTGHDGGPVVEMTMWTAPKFSVGDVIEVMGSGMRRTEFRGNAQVALSKTSEIHVIGQSAHQPATRQPATSAPAARQPAPNGHAAGPAAAAAPTDQHAPVNGQTVGMAMKEAIALTVMRDSKFDPNTEAFWLEVKRAASHIIRLSYALEYGKLSPKIGQLAQEQEAPMEEAPPPRAQRTAPTQARQPAHRAPDAQAELEESETVPF